MYSVYHYPQELFDGSVQTFEILERADTVEAIAVTTEGKIILCEEIQAGRSRPWVGLPGGRVDEDEDPHDAVSRELLEETGYEGTDWQLAWVVNPSEKMLWTIHTWVARSVTQVSIPTPDAGEKITVRLVSFDGFCNAVMREDFRDAHTALRILRILQDHNKRAEFRTMLMG